MDRDSSATDSKRDGVAIAESIDCPERFSEVFDRHFRTIHRYLARRVPSGQADDLASTTFVVAFERRGTFRTNSTTALPWLLGIATNLLRERRRDSERELAMHTRLKAEPGSLWRSSDVENGDGSAFECLALALAALDVAQLDVLLLYAWAELSYEEIAESLDVPLGTVRSRLSRARQQLRSHLLAEPDAAPAIPRGESNDR